MFKIKTTFLRPQIEVDKIPEIIFNALSEDKFASQIKPNMRIAITAGSRGVANVALITKALRILLNQKAQSPLLFRQWGAMGVLRLKVSEIFWPGMVL